MTKMHASSTAATNTRKLRHVITLPGIRSAVARLHQYSVSRFCGSTVDAAAGTLNPVQSGAEANNEQDSIL